MAALGLFLRFLSSSLSLHQLASVLRLASASVYSASVHKLVNKTRLMKLLSGQSVY